MITFWEIEKAGGEGGAGTNEVNNEGTLDTRLPRTFIDYIVSGYLTSSHLGELNPELQIRPVRSHTVK